MDKKLVTILVVEDDDALREAICDALAFADFQTLPTANGKEALAVLHGQHKIDLVLTDVEMPERGGLDLLTDIKSQWPEMPVVLMTAFAQVLSLIHI